MKKNDFKGTLEVNNNKKSPNHPDYKGAFTVNGLEYNLAAWNKISKNTNREYLSISAQKPDDNVKSYGALFINTKKVDKQPDQRGNIKLDDVEYIISGWNNEECINLVIQLKEGKSTDINISESKEKTSETDIPPESISSEEVIKDATNVENSSDNIIDDLSWNIDENV